MNVDFDDEARWQAVVARAPGDFFYGVASTGVYCRPTCPSRRPRRENVSFFATAGAAEAAGFRPCLRCRPASVPAWEQAVGQAQHLLETAERTPTLAELGQAVGMSPYHLQRLFKQATGLSPRSYAAMHRSERLKAGLQQGATVTEALYDAGYGSPRALYETAGRSLGMTPGTYRRGGQGEVIRYALTETPIGPMLVAATAKGLCALRFGEGADVLAAEFPRAQLVCDPDAVAFYVDAVAAYLNGAPHLDLPTDVPHATAFQQRVWAALRAIPYGETRSYQEVAALIGDAKAVRAVARACATNPVALVVPCHRVVRKGGDLSGYRWGVERKRALLEREKAATDGECGRPG